MRILIDIPEEIYKASQIVDVKYEDVVQIPLEVIANGTPIPDNATNGDVIKAIFPQWRIMDDDEKDIVMFNIPMKVGCEFNACSREWWNAPYQKGGKE